MPNLLAWLVGAGTDLASASATLLPRLMAEDAAAPLLDLIADSERPLEARLAATHAIASNGFPDRVNLLTGLLGNEAQQVRAIALTGLVRAAGDGDDQPTQVLANAINGVLLTPEQAISPHTDKPGSDVAAPKIEGDQTPRVQISEDGEIIEDTTPATGFATSTLGNIPLQVVDTQPPETSADTDEAPGESAGKRRRRVAVEGPNEIAEELQRLAIRLTASLPSDQVETAIIAAAEAQNPALRTAAFDGLCKRAATQVLSPEAVDLLCAGLADAEPVIRGYAAEALRLSGAAPEILSGCLNDPDAAVRASALRALGTDHAATIASFFADPALAVRHAALQCVFQSGEAPALSAGLRAALDAQQIDTLAEACRQSDAAIGFVSERLARTDNSPKQVYVLLEVLAVGASTV